MPDTPPYPHRTQPSTTRPGCTATQVVAITRDYFDQCEDYIAIDWARGDARGTAIGTIDGWSWDLGRWLVRIELHLADIVPYVSIAMPEVEELRTGDTPETTDLIIWTTATDAAAKAGVRKAP